MKCLGLCGVGVLADHGALAPKMLAWGKGAEGMVVVVVVVVVAAVVGGVGVTWVLGRKGFRPSFNVFACFRFVFACFRLFSLVSAGFR